MGYIFIWALAAIVGLFGAKAFLKGAQYRFRGHTGLAVQAAAFFLCAFYGAFLAPGFLASTVVLGAGIAAGVGIEAIKGNDRKYLD